MNSQILSYPDAVRAAEACAGHILGLLRSAIETSGQATLAISGGSSPKPMFAAWARAKFPWERVQLFWVDERVVPPTGARSNFKLANDTWLGPAKFPLANIHRVLAELGPASAAERYVQEIRTCFGIAEGELPRFDVIHRGLGPDGHTASLFPGEPLIDDRSGIAAAVWVEKFQQWRVTLLPGVLLAAPHTAMLVTGADKAPVLREVLQGPGDLSRLPAQIATRDHGEAARDDVDRREVTWFVDAAAAAEL